MQLRLLSITLCMCLGAALPYACAQSLKVRPQAPELRENGVQPAEIMNGESATIVLSGVHLAGGRLRVEGACALLSYEIAEDAEIRAHVRGLLAVGYKDNHCVFTVANAVGSVTRAVVVELTDEQSQKREARQAGKLERVGASPAEERAGKRWEIHFADGAVRVFELKAGEAKNVQALQRADDGAPSFQDGAGNSIGILVRPDNSVYLMERGCTRTGILRDGQVRDGKSLPGCVHGNWTAIVR